MPKRKMIFRRSCRIYYKIMATSKSIREPRRKIRNEISKNAMRNLCEKIKSNPLLHEEEKRKARERYQARKETGKVHLISAVSEREKRKIRKGWRERSKKAYYAKKGKENLMAMFNSMTPPNSPLPEEIVAEENNPYPPDPFAGPSCQFLKGKLLQRKNREKMRTEIEQLKKQLEVANRKAEKCKKRLARLKKKGPNNPTKRVHDMLQGQEVTPEVKRKLVIAEVVQKQIKSNFREQKTVGDKQRFINCISGDIVKKYKYRKLIGFISS
ncbi:unnamed protein product [Psylliodes chrysocephalus]|uniref:Uncharacterized protein n=1 Tax=Psylliodes chrysocephalus TaxID=3402493 RepID=A0A9P0GIS3_9CUCU|nr:unnamed protein product [Psylliodes chrysocephala]